MQAVFIFLANYIFISNYHLNLLIRSDFLVNLLRVIFSISAITINLNNNSFKTYFNV